jgi:hypothetical protein
MRCYNAVMNNRFQFSMRDLFICVTLTGLGMVGLSSLHREFSIPRFIMWCVSGVLIGGGFGVLFKKKTLGMAIGLAIQFLLTSAIMWSER